MGVVFPGDGNGLHRGCRRLWLVGFLHFLFTTTTGGAMWWWWRQGVISRIYKHAAGAACRSRAVPKSRGMSVEPNFVSQ